MRTIQHYLPNPRHTEIHRIFVNAGPERAWEAARYFDMSGIPWIKLLFEIRTLPEKFSGENRPAISAGLGVDQISRGESGFMILEEVPGKEVVVGSVGKFWYLNIPFEKVSPRDFKDFNTPGFGKIAWAISVEPFMEGSTIAIELRISATDERSWKKFDRYYQLIRLGSYPIRSSVMSYLESHLGRMVLPADDQRVLPGDEYIPDAKYGLTHHRDIEAPPAVVWQYLMQLGCDRAGWYSIDLLDNGGKASIDHVVKDWEKRNEGDRISATPENDGFFVVHAVHPKRYFVIGGETERLGAPFKMTWSFVLEPVGSDATHLITRARMRSSPGWKEWLMGKVAYPPVHGLMSHVQLDTIKNMAERDAQMRIGQHEMADAEH